MSQYVESPTKAFTAGAAIGPFLRVKLSSGKLAAAVATDVEIGTTERASFADGDIVAVRLRTAQGTRKMVAAGAITAGNPVYAAAAGKIDAAGTVYCGTALEEATADNDVIEVLPGPNTDIANTITGTNAAAFTADADLAKPKMGLKGQAAGTGNFTTFIKPEATLSADNEIIVPEANGDTLVAAALAQTLTNKTLGDGLKLGDFAEVTAAGSAQGDAASLTGVVNVVAGADNTKGVVLPAAAEGLTCVVYSSVATNGLKVYPATGDDINDGTTNTAVTIEGETLAIFLALDDTTWSAMFTANT
jgi:hypothetical protein